ncbi:hypothetical protein [Bradyrhizobium sp. USDA 3364]
MRLAGERRNYARSAPSDLRALRSQGERECPKEKNDPSYMYPTYDATIEPSPPELSRSSCGSPVDEARDLVHLCAEPRLVGDSVKTAILRASRRLGMSFNRTKDIWYGDARRIDAREMDRLRRIAEQTEMTNAVACMELVRRRMLTSRSAPFREVAAALGAALHALGGGAK